VCRHGLCDTQQPRPFQALKGIFKYTTEEMRSIATEYATSNVAAELRPTPGSREVTLSSGKEASSNAVVHDAKEGTKGGKKKHKQYPQWVTTVANYDSGHDKKAGDSGMGASRLPYTATSTRRGHQQTTLRDFSRRPTQTTRTSLNTSSKTVI
jgi:hypothetical protein